MPRVVLASQSELKENAVRRALTTAFGDAFDLYAVATDSHVSEQPIGTVEMVRGARNRMESLTGDMVIGIESGIIQMHDLWMDVAYIEVRLKSGHVHFTTTQGVVVPEAYISPAIPWGRKLYESKTDGDDQDVDEKNPHASLYPGCDRGAFIESALTALLSTIKEP